MKALIKKLFCKQPEALAKDIDESKPESLADLDKIPQSYFGLSKLENWRYRQFREQHYQKHKAEGITHPNVCTVTFIPTGIGDGKTVKCLQCGAEIDITDLDCW